MHVESSPSSPTRQAQSKPEGPDAIVRAAQRKRLERSHKHHKPVPKGERYGPLGGGTWIRPGCKRVRSDLEGWRLVDAVEWMATRRFVQWSSSDQSVLDELSVRTFSYVDLERRMVHSRASWLADVVRDQWCGDESPGFPRGRGFVEFMADLVQARRCHAVGIWISQVDAATLYGCSDRTWRRWMAHAESVKLVRIIQTWCEDDERESSHRCWGKILYMLGAAVIERAGAALYEGLELKLPDGRPMQDVAQRKARGLRRERKRGLRKRHDELWQVHKLTAPQRKTIARNKRVESHPLIGPDTVSRSTRQSRETGGQRPAAPSEKQRTIAPTSPHKWVIPCVPQDGPTREKVGPTVRIDAPASPLRSGPSKRTAANTDSLYQEPTPGALSDASSGPLGGCADSDGTWRGGGNIGAMLAERMRNGFGGVLAMLLLISGCAPNSADFFLGSDSTTSLFFLSSDLEVADKLNKNKDEYATPLANNTNDEPRGLRPRNHPKHSTDGRRAPGADISGGHLPRRSAGQRGQGDTQRSRQTHHVSRRGEAVHRAGWPARGHRGHAGAVARGAGIMDIANTDLPEMEGHYGPRFLTDKPPVNSHPIAVYFSDEGSKMAGEYRIPNEIVVSFGDHQTVWREYFDPVYVTSEPVPRLDDIADGILGFALTNNPPHNERDRVSAYHSEMRELGKLFAGASDEQLDALMPNMDLAMIDRGVNPREMPMVLADLRKKLGKIK